MSEATLLELLAPRGDEELVGAVFTTFILDGAFVEEELLTTLTGSPVGSGELARAASDLHDRLLAAPEGVAIVVDERGFDGTRRLGIYDLYQVPAPPTFHPKVALLLWQQPGRKLVVRALVTSANLTRDGHRRNAEIVVSADSECASDHVLLADIVGYLREVTARTLGRTGLLELAGQQLDRQGDNTRRLLVSRQTPLLNLFFKGLDDDEVITSAIVISPYFERSSDIGSVSVIEAWSKELLRRRSRSGLRARFVVPELFRDGQLVVEIPIARAVKILGDEAELWTLTDLWAVPGRADPVPRRLHGKLLAVETDRRCHVLVGSANFTNAALHTAGAAANWEACVLISLQPGAIEQLLPVGASQRDPSAAVFQAPAQDPPLPSLLFDHASYRASTRRLQVRPRRNVAAREAWALWVDGNRVATGLPGEISAVSTVLSQHPANFAVEQRTEGGSRFIPIEVSDKENLPLPALGMQPGGDDVLDYFAGLRTPGEFDARSSAAVEPNAQHEQLPTLEHLNRFSRALYGISDVLERPARSVLEYRARWTGPWGVERVVDLLRNRSKAKLDDPACSLFEVLELETTLRRLRLVADERCPQEAKQELRETTLANLSPLARTVAKQVRDTAAVSALEGFYRSHA